MWDGFMGPNACWVYACSHPTGLIFCRGSRCVSLMNKCAHLSTAPSGTFLGDKSLDFQNAQKMGNACRIPGQEMELSAFKTRLLASLNFELCYLPRRSWKPRDKHNQGREYISESKRLVTRPIRKYACHRPNPALSRCSRTPVLRRWCADPDKEGLRLLAAVERRWLSTLRHWSHCSPQQKASRDTQLFWPNSTLRSATSGSWNHQLWCLFNY